MFSHARFSELMQKNKVSNYKLAKFLDCSQSSVKNWLSKTEPTAEYISRIAEYFGVSVNYLLSIEDQYGLSPSDWFMMGSAYKTRRILSGQKISEAVDGELLTEEQLTAFEETGEPLTLAQIDVACGLIGTTGPDVFAAWARNLYKEELPPIVGGQLDENSLEYAAHKYEGDITPEDKATIISLMKRFAEENKKGGGNGATD